VAILVYCTSDGAVGLVKVTRICRIEAGASWSSPQPVLATNVGHTKSSICEADDRIITGLSFIEPRNLKVRLKSSLLGLKFKLSLTQPVVILFRPGVIQLWTEESNGCAWSGLRSLCLHRQGISSGSSMLYPPSGLVYSPEHDAIVLSLFDGSFHVIYDISSSPTVGPSIGSTEQSGFSSSDLSSVSRKIFIQIEGGAIPQEEMNRINGMVSFGGFPIICWTYE
jgi:general transcription factor 3C polypeptide 4